MLRVRRMTVRRYVTSQSSQLSLVPSAGQEMSTGQGAVTVICAGKITVGLALQRSQYVIVFTARRSYASEVLGVVILFVRPSVCLSHACFVTNPKNLPAIFLYHMKGQSF